MLLGPGVVQLDFHTSILLAVVLLVLSIAFAVGQFLKRQTETTVNSAMVHAFNLRVQTWWMMFAILAVSLLIPFRAATVLLFFLVSFWALREYITLTPTRAGDHRALFWVFFAFTPLQYVLVGLGREYYDQYSIVLPVYGFFFVSARVALSGDHKRFLERTAKIQAGLFVCVYALSYAPALLDLQLIDSHAMANQTNANKSLLSNQGTEGSTVSASELGNWQGKPAGILFFLILIVQMGDVFQYGWGKLLGRRIIAPTINANKTWEGFVGGVLSSALLGTLLTLLFQVTPFNVWQAALMSMVTTIMGYAGSLTMSAIKRDRGVKDYGTLVEGHPGILDRIDSICFAAPVFFHLTRAFFSR